jgi:hypothetical protein
MLFAIVSGGKKVGRYHVRRGKHGPDIRVADDRDIPCYPANSYSPQMSNKAWNHNPSRIRPVPIRGWK